MKYKTFANGDNMPALGLGTWKVHDEAVGEPVRQAIDIGYRHIDTAAVYHNESGIGAALSAVFADGKVKREDLWITSKLWNNAHKEDDVRPALKESLQRLQLDYLDLFLIHWPVVFKPDVAFPESNDGYLSLDDVPISETWRAMEECVDDGLVRHIGVSNFSAKKLGDLLDNCRIKPEVDQVELHPLLQQPELKTFCDDNGIILTAYSPLGSGDRPDFFRSGNEKNPLDLDTIKQIAKARGATPAQILLAWAINRGTAAIPKSANPKRMKENLEAADIELSGEEMDRIKALDEHYRLLDGSLWKGPNTPATLWDE